MCRYFNGLNEGEFDLGKRSEYDLTDRHGITIICG